MYLGLVNAILGSLAAAECRVLRDRFIPGQIKPPTYFPFLSTISNVVAVPKSMMIQGS